MGKITAQQIIDSLGLEPLPVEGGLFRQTLLSPEKIPHSALPDRYSADKPFKTVIYFMLTSEADSFSALHKLPTDELYHFYLGDSVELLLLHPGGRSERVILGQDILDGQHVQFNVPRDAWMGSHLLPGGDFALMGTTMAPGFTPEDFVGGERDQLIEQYPDQADLIRQLTRPDAPLHMA
jgi:predicted cupin superfamily sugar epimerase